MRDVSDVSDAGMWIMESESCVPTIQSSLTEWLADLFATADMFATPDTARFCLRKASAAIFEILWNPAIFLLSGKGVLLLPFLCDYPKLSLS